MTPADPPLLPKVENSTSFFKKNFQPFPYQPYELLCIYLHIMASILNMTALFQ